MIVCDWFSDLAGDCQRASEVITGAFRFSGVFRVVRDYSDIRSYRDSENHLVWPCLVPRYLVDHLATTKIARCLFLRPVHSLKAGAAHVRSIIRAKYFRG